MKARIKRLKPWEVVEFPWGTAIKQRRGKWTHLCLRPDGQVVNVENVDVILHDNGIEFKGDGDGPNV